MSDYIKTHIVSFLQTFVANFLTIMVLVIAAIPTETLADPKMWSVSAISAAILAAVRSAIKMSTERLIPKELGGTKA